MGRIKYILKRIKAIDYSAMWQTAKTISKKNKRNVFVLFFDMVYCGMRYKAGFSEYDEYEFFLLNKQERETFLTAGQVHAIISKYNVREDRLKFSDKSTFNEVFADYIGRDAIDIREVSTEAVAEFLSHQTAIMAKVTDSLMGFGIEKINVSDIDDVAAFIEARNAKHQYLLETYFEQHEDLARLHPNSVNTIRVITFFDGNKVHVLETVLKMGNHGSVLDNFGAGGMYTVLSDEGKVIYPAFDKDSLAHDIHPFTKEPIVGFQVPLYDDILTMLDSAARLVPTIQYVGWDIAVGQEKPVIIEGNYNSGVFQMKPSLTGNKIGLKPKFKSVIDF